MRPVAFLCFFYCLLFLTPAASGQLDKVHHSDITVIAITPDDGYFYWYGYYDKLLTDPTERYVLSMRVRFDHRTPEKDDMIEVGMTDLEDSYKWIKIGESRAWGWQQGCMLQFIPGSAEEVIWNDREGDQYVARIFNIRTKELRTLPKPVYTLTPDGKMGLGLDFARLQTRRPGYGYAGVTDTTLHKKAPEGNGIYKIDLRTGKSNMLITPAMIASIPLPDVDFSNYFHWFNHLLVNPNGSRFIFLHRWHKQRGNSFYTRMFTANMEGKDLFILDPSGNTSHFIWRDKKHVAMFTKPAGMKSRFYIFRDKASRFNVIGEDKMTVNGHQSYIPNTKNRWMVNDTYPDKDQKQTLFLYHLPDDKRIDIGKFLAPPAFRGEWRCDLHPWASRDGKKVFFQSTHEGRGRRIYMVDISAIVGKK